MIMKKSILTIAFALIAIIASAQTGLKKFYAFILSSSITLCSIVT